jgi:hypothetical protein
MNVIISLIAHTTTQGSRTIVHAANPYIGIVARGALLMKCKIFPYVHVHFCYGSSLLYFLSDNNGDDVDSEEDWKSQKRFTQEPTAELKGIRSGVLATCRGR